MKKILSILCVMTLLFACVAISVNAEGKPSLKWVKNDTLSVGNVVAYDVVVNMNGAVATLNNIAIYVDAAGLVDAGYAYTNAEKGTLWRPTDVLTSPQYNVLNTAKAKMFTLAKSGLTLDANTDYAVATIAVDTTKINSDVTFNFLNETGKITKIAGITLDGFDWAPLTINAPSSVKTLEAKDVVTVNGAKTKADGTTTDEQIGGAAALTVTIPDGVTFENNMIWSLTTADGKLFSKKLDTGLTALSGTVKLAATFVTGSHRTGEDVNTAITGVNAIFKAVDGDFYYTDAADADAQAK